MRRGEAQFLKSVDIFSSLSREQLREVRRHLTEVECAPGEAIFHQGDAGTELYIVADGDIAVKVKTSGDNDVEIAHFGRGDFFGEMSMFEDAPRSASCIVSEGGRLYRLRKEEFFALMRESPGAAIKVMYRMLNITAGRLTRTSSFLSDLVQWGEGARRRAITDDLTGLYNRRYLDDVILEQFAQARVNKGVLSLIMMDLDHFHSINDVHGQQNGDKVIAAVAPSIRDNLGDGIAARYGGDEFTIVVPGKSAPEALAIANAIRLSVEALEIPIDDTVIKVTTSQGVAEYPAHASTVEELKEQADKALYKAKEAGRNRAASV